MKSMMKVAFAALALTVATAGYSGPAEAGFNIKGITKTVKTHVKKAKKVKSQIKKAKRDVKKVKKLIKIKKPKR